MDGELGSKFRRSILNRQVQHSQELKPSRTTGGISPVLTSTTFAPLDEFVLWWIWRRCDQYEEDIHY